MTKIITIIVVTMGLTLAGLLYLQVDDELSPEAEELLAIASAHTETEAFYYLWGMEAAEEDDPVMVGRQIVASIKAAEDQNTTIEAYPEDKKLSIPSSEIFCGQDSDDCVKTLMQLEWADLPEGINTNLILSRYDKFLAMKDHSFEFLDIETGVPPYGVLATGHYLRLMEAISLSDTDRSGSVILVQEDVRRLRGFLETSNNLVAKMIAVHLINNSIDVASVLSGSQNTIAGIQPLNQSEKNMTETYSTEFQYSYNLLSEVESNQELIDAEVKLPLWVSRMLFKKNMTVNSMAPIIQRAIFESSLTPVEFNQKIKSGIVAQEPEFTIRNYIGGVLNSIGQVDFSSYTARIFDLDAKIVLFNAIAGKDVTQLDLSEIKNPYDPTKHAYYSQDRKRICFDGPLPDRKKIRCLRIAL
jgi:hypothetical protein